mgnify:CR=1 FL=1
MLCAAVWKFNLHDTATGIARPRIFANENKKSLQVQAFSLILQAFVVAAVKAAGSHCLLLEELSHTDLIDQPAFLLCLVDHIAWLAVPDQKGRGGIVHTHILRYSYMAGVGVAV